MGRQNKLDESQLGPLVDTLVSTVAPEKVILFGSHARQTAGPDSDIDLFLQIDTGRDVKAATKAAYKALRQMPARPRVAVDIVVKDQAFVERYGDLVGTVVRSVLREGKVLYAR
ncbi:MAG: nucleotidyltransferase domain-containing protein [Candidatus Latescibacteria bacterium]|nr:nucleotidyltransferase domain-containing protein [Candidatus Latescibacterota bacterium]